MGMRNCRLYNVCQTFAKNRSPTADTSSETQGQLVGAGEGLNGREKNLGEEKSRTSERADAADTTSYLLGS